MEKEGKVQNHIGTLGSEVLVIRRIFYLPPAFLTAYKIGKLYNCANVILVSF
jgi:hypothetical protein